MSNPAVVSRLLSIEEVSTFDAIFVSGGNSAVLCREMVRTGFDKVLKRAIDNGLVYVGISAGSMYAAGNLDNGLHIIMNPIIPHWSGKKAAEITNPPTEIYLSDGQALYIENDEISLI
ncbi:MAG: type 1 glutamine amidotransferase-like domain-containing protein [Lachnospiraceae bacterium]|nr:type 1 glutamine amidotransferase-like domain-containing protein [Lachnospiraceae bacterium]